MEFDESKSRDLDLYQYKHISQLQINGCNNDVIDKYCHMKTSVISIHA